MESTVAAILASGKGILAAEESLPTIEKRFKALDISCTEESRRAYRDLLVTTPGLSGQDGPHQADDQEVATATIRCLRRVVPAAVPGIVFLSGGQSDEAATKRLSAICRADDVPWKLSFSYGRALQAPALKIWKGIPGHVPAAQAARHRRARGNSLAVRGKYSGQMENETGQTERTGYAGRARPR